MDRGGGPKSPDLKVAFCYSSPVPARVQRHATRQESKMNRSVFLNFHDAKQKEETKRG